jgi:H+/gluconate symporter-like permease
MADFIRSTLCIFIFAALYSQVFTATGCVASISYWLIDIFRGSKYVVLIIPVITALFVYGGISVFVVVFSVMPIGVLLFKEANLNKSLLPALINYGATTFAMTALPGSPQLTNIIPSNFFDTKPTAAPALGFIAAFVMIILGFWYFKHKVDQFRKNGKTFDPAKTRPNQLAMLAREQCPKVWQAFVPLVVMALLCLGLSGGWFGGFTLATYPATNTAMITATLVTIVFNLKKRSEIANAIQKGASTWIKPLIALAMVIGFGNVIKMTPSFDTMVGIAFAIPGAAYVSAAVSTNIVAGITGSASGGLQITLETLGNSWLTAGGKPEVLHRICSVAAGGLDNLPFSGGLFTFFLVCNETHRDGYKHIFWTTVAIPVAAVIVITFFANLGIV